VNSGKKINIKGGKMKDKDLEELTRLHFGLTDRIWHFNEKAKIILKRIVEKIQADLKKDNINSEIHEWKDPMTQTYFVLLALENPTEEEAAYKMSSHVENELKENSIPVKLIKTQRRENYLKFIYGQGYR